MEGAFDAEECETSKQDCLDHDDYADDVNEDWGCEEGGLLDDEEIEDECTATVAEVEACLREDVGRESNLGKKYTCDDVETLSEQEEDESDTLGPACEKVFEKCPDADF